MQKITEKLKNTPRGVQSLLAPCSVSSELNREETLSVQGKVRSVISPEGVHFQHTGRSIKPLVYVFSKEGIPLMPCFQTKSNRMLKKGACHVVKKFPFTIQLNFECKNQVQKVTLGIDSGYGNIGFSAISETKELISGTIKLDGKTSERLTERRMYRRNRRNRLWYRKPKFLNRIKKEGWLPPSVQRRYDTHLSIINRLKRILPIAEIAIETANFDTQKMQNPEISGIEYQRGELQGYNVREYLLEKWGRKCAYCNKKDIPLEIEHIIPKSRGGTNRVSNLTLSCNKCNLRKGNKTAKEFGYPNIQKKAKLSLKATAFMNSIRWKLVNQLNCDHTYGYITKCNRIKLGLEKSHSNDAFVIAGAAIQERISPWNIEQKHRHNRSIQLNRKGFKPSVRTSMYKIQPKDLIWVLGKMFSVVGIQNKGFYVKVKDSKKVISVKTIGSIYNFGGFAWN